MTTLLCGVPASSLLGFGGIGGLTFGLAAKDLISNFIGGSMLAVMRPFSPGEKIYLMSVNGGAVTSCMQLAQVKFSWPIALKAPGFNP
jgi:small-conductance mechanosensitive channel